MEKKTKGIATVGASALIVATAITLTILGGPLGAGESTVKVLVPSGTYYPDSIFTVTISCTPGKPVKAWEFQLNFNQNVLQVQSISEGTFFSPYSTFYNGGIIENPNGRVRNLYDLIVGVGNKTTPGTLLTVTFKAINSGFSNITLSNVGLTNETSYIPILITNSSIRIYSTYDMNLDGNINVQDLILIANHYGETGTPGWIKEDINDDGKVSVFDLVLVASHWGPY